MIRLQQSLYGTSMPGAGAVHHIRLGRSGMSALSPSYPQLRTLVGAAGTAAACASTALAWPTMATMDNRKLQDLTASVRRCRGAVADVEQPRRRALGKTHAVRSR